VEALENSALLRAAHEARHPPFDDSYNPLTR
jgi:hypothetical protein